MNEIISSNRANPKPAEIGQAELAQWGLLYDLPPEQRMADLFAGSDASTKEKWNKIADSLKTMGDGTLNELHEQFARQIQDLGMAFRSKGDDEERPWPLNPMPLIIGTNEWNKISDGIIQRAELMEEVLRDVYGAQRIINHGYLPAAAVTGSAHFTPKMVNVKPPKGRYVHVYAADLARGPNGEWRVLSDRLRIPTGIGYSLENRLTMARMAGSLLSDIKARRLAEFFGHLRAGIADCCIRNDPRIALFTPGRFNQSYPEQAHLARYLGFPLVEGRDLAVDKGKLYVRTIEGLKRIDAIWRFINTHNIDPLAFDSTSSIGVPDLFDAWSDGELVVANWPGAGVVESFAFSAFLPQLSRTLLGQSLKMPNIATWWCGHEREKNYVIRNLDNMVIAPAFSEGVALLEDGQSKLGSSFNAQEREKLIQAINLRPMDYVGQEIVKLSTTPTLIGGKLEPRPFTLRIFVARDNDGKWVVMPGGFARLSAQGNLRTALMGKGDFSADVCVVDDIPVAQSALISANINPQIRRNDGILPSQAADNLYWFSRYCERAEMTCRIIRTLLGNAAESNQSEKSTNKILVDTLIAWGAIPKDLHDKGLKTICATALKELGLYGSVASLLGRARDIGQRLRDRLSNDFWRIANQKMPTFNYNIESMFDNCNRLIERFSALSGLAAENIGHGMGWRFLDIGRRLERALNTLIICQRLGINEPDINNLSALLDLCDSQFIYRSRYIVGLVQRPALDLILLDRNNPRSLGFQINAILEHIRILPSLNEYGMPEKTLLDAKKAFAKIACADVENIDFNWLREVENNLIELSNNLSQRYFLQYEKNEPTALDRLF